MKLPVPPQLPPRSCTITPSSSGPGGPPPLLPPRSGSTGPPPPLPPRSKVTPVVMPGPLSSSAPTAPTAAAINPNTVKGKIQEFKKRVKKISEKLSPERNYWITSDVSVKGRETSVFLFISIFVSIMTAIIPIISGDTALYDCEEDGDSGEEVCVLTGEDNPMVYLFLAFYQYPWVMVMYFKTGLWMNASGINVKINALYGEFVPATELRDWEKKDFCIFFDGLGLICCILGYAGFYSQTLCTCSGNVLFFLFLGIGGLFSLFVIIAYCGQLHNSSCDPEHRVKILSRVFFVFEMSTSGVLYIGTYGYAGVFFMIVPILGYIESFGLFDFESLSCEEYKSCCGIC